MKKLILITSLILSCYALICQTVTPYQFQVGGGATLWGLLSLPATVTTEPSALLVFEHGVGEAGSNTAADTKALYNYSPLGYVAAGINFTFTNPVDGKAVPFIVMSIQGVRGWVPSSAQIGEAVKDIKSKFNIKPGFVFITGLSAGGEATTEAITTKGVMELFSAAVPMSTPSAGYLDNIPDMINQGTSVWAFHGQQDGGLTSVYNTYKLRDAMNAYKPGYFRGTFPASDGHCCWATYYNPTYREVVDGKSMNIYEWMLSKAGRSTVVPPITPPVVLPPVNTPVFAGNDTTVTSLIVLSGVSSVTGAYSWQKISGPVANLYTSSGRWDGSLSATVLGAVPGTYVFRLNVWPKSGGAVQYDDVTVTVGTAVKTVTGRTITLIYSDGTSKVITNPTCADLN